MNLSYIDRGEYMNFIVIEGDNGTGKDTLAQALAPYGFDIVTYKAEADNALKNARTEKTIESFLEYNKVCSNLCLTNSNPFKTNLLIRYWTSTLASAYADKNWTVAQVDRALESCLKEMVLPDYFIRLTCSMDERVRRIEERGAAGNDDITLERATKYDFIFSHIMKKIPTRWIVISTSEMSPAQVKEKVLNLIYGNKNIYKEAS